MVFIILLIGAVMLLLIPTIRGAIDNSKTSKKLDELVHEVQSLRKELQEHRENETYFNKRM